MVGFGSGVVTALVTAPLDVVNTRIKGGLLPAEFNGIWAGAQYIAQREGLRALWTGIFPRTLIIGFGSSTFFWIYEKAKIVYDYESKALVRRSAQ